MTAAEVYDGPLCQGCGGPCRDWKGSVWGFTCSACITRHLAASAARADAKIRRRRERLARNTFRYTNDSSRRVSGQRRDGGAPSFVPTTVSGAGPRS